MCCVFVIVSRFLSNDAYSGELLNIAIRIEFGMNLEDRMQYFYVFTCKYENKISFDKMGNKLF